MPAPPPAGWDPNAPVIPPWVDPTTGYVIGEDYDKTPIYQWFPNGQYQWDDPYMNGDALLRNQRYPEYWSYGVPDPNWRPSFFGETPPWQVDPNEPWHANRKPGNWFGAPKPGFNYEATPEDIARDRAQYAQDEAREAARDKPRLDNNRAAYAAGARYVTNGKNFRVWYPDGYQGPRIKNASGYDMDVATPGEGEWRWNDALNSQMDAEVGQNQPASAIPPGPEPEVVLPPQAGPTDAPQAAEPQADYSPKQSREEMEYWAGERLRDPRVWQSGMYEPRDFAGQDVQNRMRTSYGPGGAARMYWNTTDPQYAALTAEQKALGESKMAAFNQQFDAGNTVNPANDKLYKVQQMSPELRARLMSNKAQSNPAQRAAWAEWGDALTAYGMNPGGNPGTGGTPPPGGGNGGFNPFAGPQQNRPFTLPPQNNQPAAPQQQNRQFNNDNPFLNAQGELRNRAVKKLGNMVARTSNPSGGYNPFA